MQIQYTNTNTNTDTEYIYNLVRKLKKKEFFIKGSFPKKLIRNFVTKNLKNSLQKKIKFFS